MLMNLPICNLTLLRAVVGLLATTALLELFRVLLILSTICPSSHLPSPTLTPMDRSHCRRVNKLPQSVLMGFVEITLASTSHHLITHTHCWYTRRTREFQESRTSRTSTRLPTCNADSHGPIATTHPLSLFSLAHGNGDAARPHLPTCPRSATPSIPPTTTPPIPPCTASHHPTPMVPRDCGRLGTTSTSHHASMTTLNTSVNVSSSPISRT